MNKIPLDDRDTYTLVSSSDTTGVFQLESSGMQQLTFVGSNRTASRTSLPPWPSIDRVRSAPG